MQSHSNTPPASADACTLLQKAEEFIAGFEDDATQDGVKPLLTGLRALIAASPIVITPNTRRIEGRDIYDSREFALSPQAFWSRVWAQREFGWRDEVGCYFVRASRYDEAGGLWQRAYPAVIDDFGTLVEVSA